MTLRRHRQRTLIAPLLITAGLVLPASSAAVDPPKGASGSGASGGAAVGGARGATAEPTGAASASAGGITVSTPAATLLRRVLRISGTVVGAAGSGARVFVQRLDAKAGWITAATAATSTAGTFKAAWRPDRPGRLTLRAVLVAPTGSGGSRTHQRDVGRYAGGAPTLSLTVYPEALATQFGDGFYGKKTACGVYLESGTLGVAHRTLPCGTKVSIVYGGRRIAVPVIDRGPYANHADWDLTEATGRALGIDGTATIGALPLLGSRSGIRAATQRPR